MRTIRKMRAATRKNPHEGYLIDFLIAFWAGVLVIGLSGDLARCQNEDERVLIQTCQPGLEILVAVKHQASDHVQPCTRRLLGLAATGDVPRLHCAKAAFNTSARVRSSRTRF
jgi:hypothetical protein